MNSEEIEGWWITDEAFEIIDSLKCEHGESNRYFVPYGVEKTTMWECGVCDGNMDGLFDTKKEADNCCKKKK